MGHVHSPWSLVVGTEPNNATHRKHFTSNRQKAIHLRTAFHTQSANFGLKMPIHSWAECGWACPVPGMYFPLKIAVLLLLWAIWIHIQYMVLCAHPSPQPIQDLDWFSHFCTAHVRVWLGMSGHVLSPKNCTLAWGDLDPPYNTWFHWSTRVQIPNDISTGSAVFTVERPYALQWDAVFPWKLLPEGDLDPIQYMIPWAHPSPQPKWHVEWFSRFCTDDCSVSLYFAMGRPSPSKLPFPWGIWTAI